MYKEILRKIEKKSATIHDFSTGNLYEEFFAKFLMLTVYLDSRPIHVNDIQTTIRKYKQTAKIGRPNTKTKYCDLK